MRNISVEFGGDEFHHAFNLTVMPGPTVVLAEFLRDSGQLVGVEHVSLRSFLVVEVLQTDGFFGFRVLRDPGSEIRIPRILVPKGRVIALESR